MRNRLFLSLIAAAVLCAASSANAGALTGATWTGTTQGVLLNVTNAVATCTSTGANIVQQVIVCPATGLGATGVSTATDYSVSLTMGLFSLSQFTTGGAININTVATLAGAQIVTGTANDATANIGVQGDVTVKVAVHTKGSLLAPGMTTLVLIPLSVGKAGTFTGFFYVLTSVHYITVDFYAWTPGARTFAGLTTKKAALPTVMASGMFGLGADGGGVVTLVSPSKVSIDGPLAQRRTASFTTLKLTYAPSAPEPGTLLLLGAGVAGLVLVGSRKRS